MNKALLSLLLLACNIQLFAQNVGIGTATPVPSAKLDITSTNSGLLIPRVALLNVTNGTTPVATPANGLLVYNTNAAVTGGSGVGFYYWDVSTWRRLTASGSGVSDVTTTTAGLTIVNGVGQVVGGSNLSIDVATNSSTSAGLVPSGAGQDTKVWGTDAAGNPAWVEATTLVEVQNGLNKNVTAPNASAANPYIELGGPLIRNTTVTQGAFNMLWNQTGTGVYRINHVNTTVANVATYPFGINTAGATNYTIGADGSFVYNQSWATKPLLINGQGNFVGINKTTAPIQNLDVNGRVNIANGVIQRGPTQITATSDLGLYQQVAGNWIRIASNAAPIKFFTDQGGGNAAGTNALVNMENASGGGVAIGANMGGATNPAPNARAVLDLQSTEKGMLTTRLTTAQRDAMGNNLPEGLLIYNIDNDCFEYWDTKSSPAGGNGFWNSLCQWCQNVVIVSANQTGFNLNSYVGGARQEHYCVYVNAGVTLTPTDHGAGSGVSGNHGFNATSMPIGSSITLYNYGTILGAGGNGGQGGRESDAVCEGDMNGQAGGAGGDAIRTINGVPVKVFNYGIIRAGGGGGGGGGRVCCSAGGGGGGGAGTPVGRGGANNRARCARDFVCGCNNSPNSTAGTNATALVNGTGGGGVNGPATACTCDGNGGGSGGNGGVNGVAGAGGTSTAAGAAGAAGLALRGAGSGSSITNFGGTVTGAVQP
jgi:hypothetical protein